METSHFVVSSLELHLFFGRIMKEHALFLRAGFTPADPDCSAKAEFYLQEFENVLSRAVALSNGVVSAEVLCAGELVTDYTTLAEKQTEGFTGIPINKDITARTLRLQKGSGRTRITPELVRQVRQLNRRALTLLDGLIEFKENILQRVRQCEMFTANYPLLIEHILREAKLYRKYTRMLTRNGELPTESMREIECFWNQIMMEHAQFIRGLLDPCETELFDTANDYAQQYCALLEASRNAHNKTMTGNALAKTTEFRDFKAAGTQGIQQGKIRSVILPLLADHVLREANHYIRLLKQ